MEYNLGRVNDILSSFNSIIEKQDSTNNLLTGLSTTVSTINLKVDSQVAALRTQIYVFSNDMGWLGIWDLAQNNYIGFINAGPSNVGSITIARKTGTVFLFNQSGSKILIVAPYLPGVIGALQFVSVASFTVSPDGTMVFASQNNSSVLVQVDANTGKTVRNFTLPGTALHLTLFPEAFLIYFSVAGTKAVYSVQYLSGEIVKVFDLPDDAVKLTSFRIGNEFGLLVLTGSGNTAAITRWDNITNTTSTVQVPNASEIVANPYTGQSYVASLQNILFLSLDGAVLKTVAIGDTASQLTLTADGVHLIAVVSPGHDSLLIDTITGVFSTGPITKYPPTQQAAQLLLAQAQFGFTSN